jgi:predicted dehydrogenase
MEKGNQSRRGFLQRSLAALTAAGMPAWYAREVVAADEAGKGQKAPTSPNERLVMGAIGIGSPQSRGLTIYNDARKASEGVRYAAACDVDAGHLARALEVMKKDGFADAKGHKDYRELLDNKDVQAVTIATPDHWHALVAAEALRKGKDVYCEKPLTLTVAEGQQLVKVAKETGRVFQVGSQQRSNHRFRLACELVRNGRIGKVKVVETRIGGIDPAGTGPFQKAPVPSGLDWDFWLGPAPLADYIPQRGHYEFRWWYEYSGGKMTDWGAHHNDIAQWGLGMDDSGPVGVEATGYADPRPDCYNVHTTFLVRYRYANGTELICTSGGDKVERDDPHGNGVRFVGEDGQWIFVSRGTIKASSDKLLHEPLPAGATRLYVSDNHMRNFLDCVRTRKPTICPADVGFRSVTVCHVGVIALRTGKKLRWDPVAERFDDDEANRMLSRPMRSPWKLEG